MAILNRFINKQSKMRIKSLDLTIASFAVDAHLVNELGSIKNKYVDK